MSFTDLFTLVVIRHKVMTVTEFFDADVFTLDLVVSHLDEVERDASERMRSIMWAVLAPNTKKRIEPNDVIKFPWEREGEQHPTTTKEMFDNMFNNKKD